LVKTKWICFPRWCGRFGLLIKKGWIKILWFLQWPKIFMAQKFTLYYYVKVWIIFIHDYVIFNAFQVIQRFFLNKNLPLVGTLWDPYTTKVPKRNDFFFKTVNDNFEFLFILHYYSCSGLLYVNRKNDVLLNFKIFHNNINTM
jgi:hypothetical protein